MARYVAKGGATPAGPRSPRVDRRLGIKRSAESTQKRSGPGEEWSHFPPRFCRAAFRRLVRFSGRIDARWPLLLLRAFRTLLSRQTLCVYNTALEFRTCRFCTSLPVAPNSPPARIQPRCGVRRSKSIQCAGHRRSAVTTTPARSNFKIRPPLPAAPQPLRALALPTLGRPVNPHLLNLVVPGAQWQITSPRLGSVKPLVLIRAAPQLNARLSRRLEAATTGAPSIPSRQLSGIGRPPRPPARPTRAPPGQNSPPRAHEGPMGILADSPRELRAAEEERRDGFDAAGAFVRPLVRSSAPNADAKTATSSLVARESSCARARAIVRCSLIVSRAANVSPRAFGARVRGRRSAPQQQPRHRLIADLTWLLSRGAGGAAPSRSPF